MEVLFSLSLICLLFLFMVLLSFFSSRRRHTRYWRDWSSDVCSSDLAFAQQVEQAGADALEVNVMRVETDPSVSGGVLEEDYAKLAQCVVRAVQIPVVFKLPDTFTNVTYVAGRLAAAGVKGVTCFNKVWQTDINIETLEMEQGPVISSGRELYKTLKYTGLLSALLPQLQVSASGGVMTGADVVKCLLVGANSVQVVSTLYLHRAAYIQDLLQGVSEW